MQQLHTPRSIQKYCFYSLLCGVEWLEKLTRSKHTLHTHTLVYDNDDDVCVDVAAKYYDVKKKWWCRRILLLFHLSSRAACEWAVREREIVRLAFFVVLFSCYICVRSVIADVCGKHFSIFNFDHYALLAELCICIRIV